MVISISTDCELNNLITHCIKKNFNSFVLKLFFFHFISLPKPYNLMNALEFLREALRTGGVAFMLCNPYHLDAFSSFCNPDYF